MFRRLAGGVPTVRWWLMVCVMAVGLAWGWASPANAAFEIDLAVELGRLSLQAYQMLIDFENEVPFSLPAPYVLVDELLTQEPLSTATPASGPVPIAFVATSMENEAVYVVFRGTVTAEEFLLDAQIGQVPYTPVPGRSKTEEGFTRVYGSIRESLIEVVQELQESGLYSKLFITGHSLGAALAAMAVPDLVAATQFTRPTAYTFARPFVGNVWFSRLYRRSVGESWQVVNTNDIVPKLPPPLTITQDGVFFYAPLPTRFAITFGEPITAQNFFDAIEENHRLCNYYNTLCELTADPAACMAAAGGAGGCNPAP